MKTNTEISKYLSYILRHNPSSIGLDLDKNGWAFIEDIIDKTIDFELDFETIEKIVISNDKNRFSISECKTRIRANQGHSISVDLELRESEPPEYLYHGTAERFLESILSKGLNSGKRNHVHLTTNIETALTVGSRYGKPIILRISANEMYIEGRKFYLSENGVWLTNDVEVKYIEILHKDNND